MMDMHCFLDSVYSLAAHRVFTVEYSQGQCIVGNIHIHICEVACIIELLFVFSIIYF